MLGEEAGFRGHHYGGEKRAPLVWEVSVMFHFVKTAPENCLNIMPSEREAYD